MEEKSLLTKYGLLNASIEVEILLRKKRGSYHKEANLLVPYNKSN